MDLYILIPEKSIFRNPMRKNRRLLPAISLLSLLSLLFLLPFLFFLEQPLLIPVLFILFCLNLFLFFRCETALLKLLPLTPLPGEDPWGLGDFLKKSAPPSTTIHLIKGPSPLCLCFGGPKQTRIVFSEKLLDMLSGEERKMIVSYFTEAGKRGWVFFLTLLSFLLRGTEKLFSLIGPLGGEKSGKPGAIFLLLINGTGVFTRKIFLAMDRSFKGRKKQFARTLWKIQSLHETTTDSRPIFLIPLYFGGPRIISGRSIPLQPDIRKRTQALTGAYPP